MCSAAALPWCHRARKRRIDKLLELVFSHWWLHGVWPCVDHLQKELLRRPDEQQLDVRRTSARLSRTDGFLNDNRLVLTVSGLHRISTASDVLADFMATIRLAYERYEESGQESPSISVDDLERSLHLSGPRIERVAQLLDTEADVFARVADPGSGAATWTVRNSIYDYRAVVTVEDYLAVQRRRKPAPVPRRSGLGGWFARRQVTIRDLLIVTMLGVVAAAGLGVGIAYSPLGPSTPSTTSPRDTTPADPPRSRPSPRHPTKRTRGTQRTRP